MNNFVIDTPDNFWQIRWLDKYMEGHKGFIAGIWKWRDKSRIQQVKYRKRNLCALAELCNEHIIQ